MSNSRRSWTSFGRPFASFVAMDAVMLLSLMLGRIAVPWWIAQKGGGAHLALYAAIGAAASMLALPVLSPIVDRHPKRLLVMVGLTALVVESAALAAAAQAGFYDIYFVVALSLVGVAASSILMPLSQTIVADLLAPDRLTDGLGLQKSVQSLGRLLGPVLAGVVLASADVATALWVQALLFVVSITIAASMSLQPCAGSSQQSARVPRRWIEDLQSGLRAKWGVPLDRAWTFVSLFANMALIPAIGMLVPLKIASLSLSGAWLAASEGGLAAGLLLGGLGGAAWISKRIGRANAVIGALLCQALCMGVIGLTPHPLVLVTAFVVLGYGVVTVQLVGNTHRLLATPAHFRGRMAAANLAIAEAAVVIGASASGAMLSRWSIEVTYVVLAGTLFLAGLAYSMIPGFRAFLRLDPEAVKGHFAVSHPELFDAEAGPAPTVIRGHTQHRS